MRGCYARKNENDNPPTLVCGNAVNEIETARAEADHWRERYLAVLEKLNEERDDAARWAGKYVTACTERDALRAFVVSKEMERFRQ